MYREQRNVTPGALSEWFYINDIIHDNRSNIRLFTDGISLFIIENDPVTVAGCMKIDVGKMGVNMDCFFLNRIFTHLS